MYDISIRKVIISRKVVFHEDYFPFHHVTDSDDDTIDPSGIIDDFVIPLLIDVVHLEVPHVHTSGSSSPAQC